MFCTSGRPNRRLTTNRPEYTKLQLREQNQAVSPGGKAFRLSLLFEGTMPSLPGVLSPLMC